MLYCMNIIVKVMDQIYQCGCRFLVLVDSMVCFWCWLFDLSNQIQGAMRHVSAGLQKSISPSGTIGLINLRVRINCIIHLLLRETPEGH